MEYGKDKIIITADCIRELIEFAMDIQDELSRKSQKLEMLERYYGNTTYIPDEVSVILDIEPCKLTTIEPCMPTTAEKETKKEYLVDMPEGSVPY